MKDSLPLRPLPPGEWVSLTSAVMWASYHHAVEADELFSEMLAEPDDLAGRNREKGGVTNQLQQAWRDIADKATVGIIQVCGKREKENQTDLLALKDLRSCQYLAWRPEIAGGPLIVRVQRYPDTYDGAWDSFDDPRGSDFWDVSVARRALLELYPVPTPGAIARRASQARFDAAVDWLKADFAEKGDAGPRKAYYIETLRTEFGLNATQAKLAWRFATKDFPMPRGRPRKEIRPE